jgi:diacylglycerol kinase (ATP)
VRQFLLIVNGSAGRGRARTRAAEAARLLTELGHEVRVAVTMSAENARARVDECDPETVIIGCGGDGTVHGLLDPCIERGLTLGVLPAGSGNDIARTLGIHSASVAELVRLWGSTQPRPIDVGRVEPQGEWFLGVLSAGFDSRVNERAHGRPGGTWRYLTAMVAEMGSLKAAHYRLNVDGEVQDGMALLVCVGNGRTYGSGMAVCPSADSHDGLLDVTWVGEVSTPTFLRLFPRVYSGSHVDRPEVRTFQATRVAIDAPGQVAYADGERIGPLPIDVRIHPGALHVLSRPPAA